MIWSQILISLSQSISCATNRNSTAEKGLEYQHDKLHKFYHIAVDSGLSCYLWKGKQCVYNLVQKKGKYNLMNFTKKLGA